MTQTYIDDVTGDVIGGDTERWYRIGGLKDTFGQLDVADLDTLLTIIRDHLESDSPAPLDLYTLKRIPGDKPPALEQYAPPRNTEATPDDAPMGPIYRFKIPEFSPALNFGRSPRYWPKVPNFGPNALTPPTPEALARVDRTRAKYVRAMAAACGCNDTDAHERNLP